MKTRTTLAVSALALALGFTGFASTKALAQQPGPPPPGYQEGGGGWDAPPPEFREFQRQGFHDGVEGARKDMENHRSPNVENRDEFRHPHVPHDMRHDYREGFRRGYNMAIRHMMGEHHDHDGDRPY